MLPSVLNGEELEYLTVVGLPIPIADLKQIETMLCVEAPFCTSFPEEDVYSIKLYLEQSALHDTTVCMMIDRNVFARVVDLASGARAKQEHRIPAAIMAFAQCARVEIEPNLALYEGVATQAVNRASHDLAMFRAADNHNPSEFADIALGRSTKLHGSLTPKPHDVNLEVLTGRLRQYSFVYPLVLKIAVIELEGGPMTQRMHRFLDWAYENWYFSAAATTLAAMCFSKAPPKDVLKNLRSSDRSLALHGLRNCAWDLTYITWWLQRVKQQDHDKKLYVLCSCDRALRSVAHHILGRRGRREESHRVLQDLLGGSVYEHYTLLVKRSGSTARVIKRAQANVADHKTLITEALERQFVAMV
jgi:hypothetical protein